MARLFGLIGNRADLAQRVLESEADLLRARAHGSALGWGVGFYQGGEVLMRRRPMDDRAEIDVATVVTDLRADVLVGHVRNATVGALRTENTHPFRYRQWLYAQTGTLPAYDRIREPLMASVPEFLRSSVRGETDAEVLFYVFLSFLHDAGLLNDFVCPASKARDALRAAVAVVDAMAAEVGGGATAVNVLISNGEHLLALHRGEPLAYRVFAGRSDAEYLMGDDHALRRKIPELDKMRFALIASDIDDDSAIVASSPAGQSRWTTVNHGAIVTIERDGNPVVCT